MKVAILTISDKGSRGERNDESGEVIRQMMASLGAKIVSYDILPDEREVIAKELVKLTDEKEVDLILTTGGTGFSPRDITPEATLAVIDREAPGLAEAMRQESLKITPRAMLSRAVSGIRKETLIVNLPGSPKAARECLQVILPAISHGIEVLKGQAGECAHS